VITENVNNSIVNISSLVHPKCIVCSLANANGLHLEYTPEDDGSVKAMFECGEAFEGYPGVLHGGVTSSIIDGAMGHCMFARGQTAVTVEMTTRFRHPILIGQKAIVFARITRSSHPLYLLEAEIIQDGKVKATAKGKYFDQPKLANLVENIS